jgi:hypothetical protein
MKVERILRGIAGLVILVSLALAVRVNQNWLWLTALVGLNLLQSAFTDWCPMMWVLRQKTAENEEGGR